jgi:alcohol/geraniol dehydrogenase (NADP+)
VDTGLTLPGLSATNHARMEAAMEPITAYAAPAAGAALEPFVYDPGPPGDEDVEIRVEHCGICHSDLSMLDNEWGRSGYPLVPGHEIVGTVIAAGAHAKGVTVGDRVGLGWFSSSCMHCAQCMGGDHNLCGDGQETIVGRHGGFADRVRCHWSWAIRLPQGLHADSAGPLFCAGATVFNPIVQFGVRPTDRVGVVGIGGLGHLAVQFLARWGCEVTAFTSSEAKRDEALKLGAHHAVSSTDKTALKHLAGRFDFVLVTVSVSLQWSAYIRALAPRGRLHFVGAVLDPIPVAAFSLIGGQKSLSGSPLSSPATMARMLEFCARHDIRPMIEAFPMAQVNDALEHLRAGKARYRVVVRNAPA